VQTILIIIFPHPGFTYLPAFINEGFCGCFIIIPVKEPPFIFHPKEMNKGNLFNFYNDTLTAGNHTSKTTCETIEIISISNTIS